MFILLIVFAGLYAFRYKKRKILLAKFAAGSVIDKINSGYDKKKQNLKIIFIISAVFLSIITLLRPQWGFHWHEVKHQGVDIFIAVDVSKSMLTKDVLPSRLARAKLAIEDIVQYLKGDRIGLIAFAGSAFIQCPLTIDYNGFLLAVEDLNVNIIPKGGTNIEVAINEALESFTAGSEGIKRALIIITDGETHQGNLLRAVEKAKAKNIKIYTIGVGTKEGELIDVVNEEGQSSFLKDNQGRVVKSRLNEELLKDIALKSEGTYIKSTPTQFGLDLIFKNKIAKLEKRQSTSKMEKRPIERFQFPLALALLLLFIEPFIANRKNR